jgi:hypothetical protein
METPILVVLFFVGGIVGWNYQSNHIEEMERSIRNGTFYLHGSRRMLTELTPAGAALIGGVAAAAVGGLLIGGTLRVVGY